jgi:type III pantothenate kinase
MTQRPGMLAFEVGSSRIKLGWFPSAAACASEKASLSLPIAPPALPEPAEVFRIDHRCEERAWLAEVNARLDELALPAEAECLVAVVRQPVAEVLVRDVLRERSWGRLETLRREQIPLAVDVREPQRLGIDRMLNAVAANRLRRPERAAIVVDMGTAMTVNFVSADGVFRGGAILAGPATTLTALHGATSSLPLLGHDMLSTAPPVVGKSTAEAMAAGAYWGAIGAVRQIIERMAAGCEADPDVVLTGGAAETVAEHIGLGERPARFVPHLVLAGIRLSEPARVLPP